MNSKNRHLFFYNMLYLSGCIWLSGISANAATLPVIPDTLFTITDFGANAAAGDNAAAIQKTIDTCAASGGGCVVIPAGTFLCGPIVMKSTCNLRISAGATLKVLPYGSGNGVDPGSYPNSGTTDTYSHFIYGKNLTNIEISGSGTIEGQGAAWWAAFNANGAIHRPCLVRFDACSNIAIVGITLQNAPNVHITIGSGSFNTTISNIIVNSPSTSPNTDGIDTWSPHIDILHCSIACGDDNIAMDNNSQDITIKNCAFGTGHGCSIGSYANNIDSITVDSCTFIGTTAGIRMKSNRTRGGAEQYLSYSNITMSGVKNPVYITSYYPSTPASPSSDSAQPVTATTPKWQHIILKNITITGSDNAGILWGLPEQSISDVVFDNVKIAASSAMKAYFVTGLVFKNGSSITVTSGNAITTYSASISGINLTSGKPTGVETMHQTLFYPVSGGRMVMTDGRIFNAAGRLVDMRSNMKSKGLRITNQPGPEKQIRFN